ncbi:MAG: hypothetical protein D6683_05085 [Actinomyces sp.]|nr:MAG: hypothetical protein D6683_05085 [Actinomyces sp.]
MNWPNYEVAVGDELALYAGPARVNGRPVTARVWFPLASTDLRLRWEATGGADLDLHITDQGGVTQQAALEIDHPHIGSFRVDATVNEATTSIAGSASTTTGFGTVDSEVLGDRAGSAQLVSCGWLNLPSLAATPSGSSEYPTVLSACGWNLALRPIEPFTERVREFRRRGHPVYVSHHGELTRADGHAFSAEDALETLHAFQLALSFVLGRFVAPLAPAGERHGEVAWVLAPAWFCDEGVANDGIIWPLDPEDLTGAVARIVAGLLDGADASHHLRHVLMHAVGCHRVGFAEQRLLTAQAGLEFFHNWQGGAGIGGAATRISGLLQAAGISTELPPDFDALTQLCSDPDIERRPSQTGPDAVVWVRNEVTHPKDPRRLYDIDRLVYEASALAREYLELLILHRLDYRGYWRKLYRPGAWAFERERVPWA